MRVKLVKDFIVNNAIEQQKEYNNLLLDKLKRITIQNNIVSFYMIIIVIIYFFFKDSTIKDVNISFIKIDKFEVIAQFTPPIFSLILLYYIVLNSHRAELIQFSRILTYEIYKNTIEDKEKIVDNEANTFARIIQPSSPWLETSKWDINGKTGCADAILRLPILFIPLLPFVFIIYSLKVLYVQYWQLQFSIYVFIFSIWITLYLIYSVLRVMRNNYKWATEI